MSHSLDELILMITKLYHSYISRRHEPIFFANRRWPTQDDLPYSYVVMNTQCDDKGATAYAATNV